MDRKETVSKVLDLKTQKKEAVEAVIKDLNGRMQERQDRIDALEEEYGRQTRSFHQIQMDGGLQTSELGLYYQYFASLNSKMQAMKGELAVLAAELDRKQSELVEAHKEKKLFEVMMERIIRDEKVVQEKTAQKEMDFQYLTRRKHT